MDIVRVTLSGYGCDVVRGIITKKDYEGFENSDSLVDVWVKDLNKKVIKKNSFKQEFHDYGITKGDIIVTVNDSEILNLPINILDSYTFNDVEIVDLEGYSYPITEDVIVTSIQSFEGVIMDVIFITKDDFDFSKFKFIQKEIHDEYEKPIITSLISEIYYDGERIKFNGANIDLRMSKVYFDTKDKKFKNEKNSNR